jgi:hypothetical protein
VKELETLRRVLEAIELGAEAAEAVWNFCEWLFRDPEEAARVAKSKAQGQAAGRAAYDAAKNAGQRGKK